MRAGIVPYMRKRLSVSLNYRIFEVKAPVDAPTCYEGSWQVSMECLGKTASSARLLSKILNGIASQRVLVPAQDAIDLVSKSVMRKFAAF